MPASELWRTNIERLRTEFEESAREFPDLRLVLWRIPKDLGERASRQANQPASTTQILVEWTRVTFRQGEPLLPFNWYLKPLEDNLCDVGMFCGTDAGRRRFEELAGRAVNCAGERLSWLSPP